MQWLDYRPIDARSGWTDGQNRAPIEIEQPVGPQANIAALVASGERPRLEFKETTPSRSAGPQAAQAGASLRQRRRGDDHLRDQRDETAVTGLSGGDTSTLRDQLVNLFRAAVVPTPQVTVTPYTIDGKLILALDVEQGQSPPYGLITSPDTRDKREFYVRRGASTRTRARDRGVCAR
jgi:hypothetical protein